jgi:lysophospholipase L1-like esterase
MLLIALAILVVAELVALGWLASTVKSYRNYWQKRAQESGEITYLALGDSAAQGIGASSPSKGYVGLVADRLQQKTGKTIKVINLSKTGAKMQDYLSEQSPQVQNIKADVVTIEIGANDVAIFEKTKFRSEFKKVLATLPDGTFVANMPLFNSRPTSTNKAKQASEIIENELFNYPHLVFVDLQKQTTEHQSIFGFAPDMFHPNNMSYKNWADAFWIQIERNLPTSTNTN